MLLWSMWWDQTPTYKLSPSTRDGQMIGKAWRKRRWSQHQLDALASIWMCKRMINDQVKLNAEIWKHMLVNQRQRCKINNDINWSRSDLNKCCSNKTHQSPPIWCEAPHMWNTTGFQTETTRCCHSFFFESSNRNHCSETEQNVFNICCHSNASCTCSWNWQLLGPDGSPTLAAARMAAQALSSTHLQLLHC